MKNILIASLLSIVSHHTIAQSYYDIKVRPANCTFGGICHESEYRTERVFLETRKIKILHVKYDNNGTYAQFSDLYSNKMMVQKSCPSLMTKLNKIYYVQYDPYKNIYGIMCENFK